MRLALGQLPDQHLHRERIFLFFFLSLSLLYNALPFSMGSVYLVYVAGDDVYFLDCCYSTNYDVYSLMFV